MIDRPELRSVVIVLDNANIDGGSAKVALSSAGALANLGYSVHIFSAVPATVKTRSSLPDVIKFTATNQLEILKDPDKPNAAARGIWNRTAYQMLARLLLSFDRRSTIVHLHGWTKALSASVARASLDAGFVTTIGLHEYFTICPIGSLFDHRRGEICRRTPMSLSCITANCDSRSYTHKAYRVLRQIATNRLGGVPKEIRHFVAVSQFSREILEPQLPTNARIYDVSNPVDPPRIDRIEVKHNKDFVYVGRLSAEKGPLLFANAIRRIGGRAIFAGDGELRDQIRAILPESEITGWLDARKLASVLSRARAIVVPSLWYETFGLVVLEAASAGVPAIVPDECAARDLIVEAQTGSLFQTGRIDSLAKVMASYSDDDFVSRLGTAAYNKFWREEHSVEAHARELVTAYSDMIEVEKALS